MNSINPTVRQALAGCGVPAFFHAWQKSTLYPTLPSAYITYHEMLTQPELSADDVDIVYGRYVRVSVWSNGDTAPIAALVIAGMEGKGFALRGARDLYEDDTKTYHWASDWVLLEEREG